MRNTYFKIGNHEWEFVRIQRPGLGNCGISNNGNYTREIAQKTGSYKKIKK